MVQGGLSFRPNMQRNHVELSGAAISIQRAFNAGAHVTHPYASGQATRCQGMDGPGPGLCVQAPRPQPAAPRVPECRTRPLRLRDGFFLFCKKWSPASVFYILDLR